MQPLKKGKKKTFSDNIAANKINTGLILYYDGYVSYDSPNIFFTILPLKEVSVEKLIAKKMNISPNLYYDGYGNN